MNKFPDDGHICLKARAKINLALDVCGKRSDGYHELRTVMQTISLFDSVYLKRVNKSNYLKLVTDVSFLPVDSKNIAYKAAQSMTERFDIKEGIFLQINKNIPVSAGLAGGSADCAATLIGIRNMFKIPVSFEELCEIGKTLGADVPFCLLRGTALAEGIGEKLTRLRPLPNCHIVLIKPPIIVSTSDVFKAFRVEAVKERPDIEKLIFYIDRGNLPGICSQMKNSLESVTVKAYPIINEIKELMLEKGALGAQMSGSGPTVFGIYDSLKKAKNAFAELRYVFPEINDAMITRAFNTYM